MVPAWPKKNAVEQPKPESRPREMDWTRDGRSVMIHLTTAPHATAVVEADVLAFLKAIQDVICGTEKRVIKYEFMRYKKLPRGGRKRALYAVWTEPAPK
jgi:hypothetical protein